MILKILNGLARPESITTRQEASIGANLRGFETLATSLLAVAVVGYVVLLVLNIWRLIAYRADMMRDFKDPLRAFGFFTLVAGTNVIAAAFAGNGEALVAMVLLAISLPLWIILGYALPWAAIVQNKHRPMLARAHGSWFVWAVASQSVAVVAADLQPLTPAWMMCSQRLVSCAGQSDCSSTPPAESSY